MFTYDEKGRLRINLSATAGDIDIVDVGALYAATEVESALAEVMTDLNGFPDELKNMVAVEIQQLENIGDNIISASIWGQVANMGATTISAAQWGYLGAMNQGVAIGSVPCFLVHPYGTQSDIATGSDVTIAFGTEVFDIGGNFASNTFTAPVTGKYLFSFSIRAEAIDSGANWYRVQLVTSNRVYEVALDPMVLTGDIDAYNFVFSLVVDMDATDTAYLDFKQSGGAQQTDITSNSYFSGVLIG